MIPLLLRRALVAVTLLATTPWALALVSSNAPTAARMYAQVRPAVLTVNIVPEGGSEPSLVGTAFFVDRVGRAVTAYHVIARHARKPRYQHLEVVLAGGRHASASVVAIDVVNDLAVLQVDTGKRDVPFVPLPVRQSAMEIGATIHALGDGAALGVTVMSGHFSGVLFPQARDLLHFSGALNGGMSGGPAVDDHGVLVGVVVAKRNNSEQIGLLVPVGHVLEILAGLGPAAARMDVQAVNAATARQIGALQRRRADRIDKSIPTSRSFGPYRAVELLPAELECEPPNPPDEHPEHLHVISEERFCRSRFTIEVDEALESGYLAYTYIHLKSVDLDRWRFQARVEDTAREGLQRVDTADLAPQQCIDRLTVVGANGLLPVRVVWCTQAYRSLVGLYDVKLVVTTRDRPGEALVARLSLEGVDWETGEKLTRRVLRGLQ